MAKPDAHTAYPAEVYESFDAFMQQIIRDTYERGAKRPEFVALVLASGELLPMAWGRVKKAGVRDVALGAAGVVALRLGIRWLVGGPLGVILTGLGGVALARFRPAGMAKAAFATAAVTFVVPVVGLILKPSDFSPGIPQVFLLNGVFVLMFIASGLLLRHAAGRPGPSVLIAA